MEGKGADCFLEEGGFFALRLAEGDVDLRAAEGDGDSGKSRAGAVIEESLDAGGQGDGGGDGFDKVAGKDDLGIADCGEVDAGVPAED
jgi:hypothetical protein